MTAVKRTHKLPSLLALFAKDEGAIEDKRRKIDPLPGLTPREGVYTDPNRPHIKLERCSIPNEHGGFVVLRQIDPVKRDLVSVYPLAFSSEDADAYYTFFANTEASKYTQPEIKMGAEVKKMRHTQFAYTADGRTYTYNSYTSPGYPFSEMVHKMHNRIRELAPGKYACDYFLMNKYLPTDHLGAHADKEADLQPDAPIVGACFGLGRYLIFRFLKRTAKETKAAKGEKAATRHPVLQFETTHGMMYIMHPGCQQVLSHEVSKSLRGLRPNPKFTCRISATGRTLRRAG